MADKQKASVKEALKAYPWVLLYRLGHRGMVRHRNRRWANRFSFAFLVDGITLSNKLYLIGARNMKPWESRYPRWAVSRGGSCGTRLDHPEGLRCQVSGLGHPGPHRRNPALLGAELPVVATGWGRAGNAS